VHWLQSAEDPPPSKGHGAGIREKAGGDMHLERASNPSH
jgi:hypothetical protein